MRKIFFCSLIFIAAKSLAQDPQFAQHYSSGLQMNPAFAGAYANPALSFLYRSQWPSLSYNHINYTISYNHYINKLKSGFGFYYMNETEGDIYKTQSYHFDFSPSISLDSNWVLKPAVEAAYYKKKMTRTYFPGHWSQRYDTSITKEYVDFSAGLLLYQKYFDFGFAVHHLLEPDERFYIYEELPLPRRYVAHSSGNIPLNEKETSFLSPGIHFVMQQDFLELKLNIAAKLKMILLQVGYYNKDSFSFMAGFTNKRFRMSYSYDITVSKLRNAAAGSHELFVAYFIPGEKLKNKKPAFNRVAF